MTRTQTQHRSATARDALAVLLAVGWVAGLLLRSAADEPSSIEDRVKAAFLFNFAKFVDWPPESFADPSTPIIIGVLGREALGSALEEMAAGKSVNNHTIRVERFARPEDLAPCHILFVGAAQKDRLEAALARLKGRRTLTVGETDGFLEKGGMINFIVQDNKIRFAINLAAAEHASLKISSQLLKLATLVKREPGLEGS